MNIALGSPVEALALDYLNFGFLTAVKNIWTWIAFVTGAVSFLITFRKPSNSIPSPGLSDLEIQPLDLVPEPDTSGDVLAQELRVAPEGSDWTTKKKFTTYYGDDDVEVVDLVSEKVNELRLNRAPSEWECEGMLRMRILNGDEMGWYRYQDLTRLTGNVVRLWERN